MSGRTLEGATARLAGRRIIVTGVSSGMGRAIAYLFAAEGAKLTLVDWQEKGLGEVAEATSSLGIAADVSSEKAVESFVAKAAAHMGGIDGIVNAAGIFARIPIGELTVEQWHKTIAVNLTGPFLICRAAMPHLQRADAATIVNIASTGALQPGPSMTAYVASKGGLIGLSRALAVDLGPRIRVNTICPGMIRTGITEALYPDAKTLDDVAASRAALQRIGTPEEIAQATLFLTSQESSFTSGAIITVDGGKSYY